MRMPLPWVSHHRHWVHKPQCRILISLKTSWLVAFQSSPTQFVLWYYRGVRRENNGDFFFFFQWCGLWQMWYYIVSVRLVQTLSFLTVVIHNSMKITLSVSVVVLLCAPFNKSLITPTLCIPCSFPFIVITHQRFGTLEISKLLMTCKFVSSIQNFISIFIYNFTWFYTVRWFILFMRILVMNVWKLKFYFNKSNHILHHGVCFNASATGLSFPDVVHSKCGIHALGPLSMGQDCPSSLPSQQQVSAYNDINTLRPGQNGCHFADNIFKCIFLNMQENALKNFTEFCS